MMALVIGLNRLYNANHLGVVSLTGVLVGCNGCSSAAWGERAIIRLHPNRPSPNVQHGSAPSTDAAPPPPHHMRWQARIMVFMNFPFFLLLLLLVEIRAN